jgi:hypothetical protein
MHIEEYLVSNVVIIAFHILHTRGIFVFCMVLRRISDYLPIQNYYMTGFHKRGGVCSLRGTDRIFKHFTDSFSFIC